MTRCVSSSTEYAANSWLQLTIAASLGSSMQPLSFDSPVVSNQSPVNGAISGEFTLTLHGMNFGGTEFTPTARIGSDHCLCSMWTSNSRLICTVPAVSTISGAQSLSASVTVNVAIGTQRGRFSFDAPVVSHVSPANGAVTGGSARSLVFAGLNFGAYVFTPSTRLAGVPCATSTWSSATTLKCCQGESPYIAAGSTLASVSLLAHVGTSVNLFTFDTAFISSIDPSNWPLSGTTVLRCFGLNFGNSDFTPTAIVGPQACSCTSWSTYSSVVCESSASLPSGSKLILTSLASQVGTTLGSFTFDAPIVSAVNPANAPPQAAPSAYAASPSHAVVSNGGLNFGLTYEGTPSSHIGASTCLTSSWTSISQVVCVTPTGHGRYQSVAVILAEAGTLHVVFTFDAPIVSWAASKNFPRSGRSQLLIRGWNFGKGTTTPTAALGGSACVSSSWLSLSTVRCTVAPSDGSEPTVGVHAAVTLGQVVGTLAELLSYDSPVVTFLAPANAPSAPTGGDPAVTFHGVSFGVSDSTATAALQSAACSSTQWASDTLVICNPAYTDELINWSAAVTVGNRVGTAVRLFTFDRAVLTEMMSANGPLTGGAHIRLSGLEFSMADTTMSASIDATQQRTTSWSSATSVRIELCAGTGAEPVVTLTIAQLVSSAIGAFSYDGPVLSALQPMNAASSSKHISLHGLNFGRMQNASAAVCATIGWTALSTLVCSLSSGALQQQMQQHNFALTMDILVGTEGARTLSFDAPVLSHARAINVPTCAGASLTVVGTNFGEWDATSSARTTAHNICATLSWTSVTTAACGTSGVSDRQNMLALTVSTTVGSGLALLSFDAPVLTQMAPLNSPTSGPVGPFASAGLNFRQADLSFSVRIGASLCASSAWSSATSVRTNACLLHVVGFPHRRSVFPRVVDVRLCAGSLLFVTGCWRVPGRSPFEWCFDRHLGLRLLVRRSGRLPRRPE